jgi:ADP-ribosylglycohydrolase
MCPYCGVDGHERAVESLRGLAVGDAFGERFFGPPWIARRRIERRELPPPPWRWTDDTALAVALVRVLAQAGRVDQDALARAFGAAYRADPYRGYGAGMHRLLPSYREGGEWRELAAEVFPGGSLGNGAAMRVAPLGAFFAGDPDRAAAEAALASEVTHAHPEGVAGGAAVAAAAALAAQPVTPDAFLERLLDHVPPGAVREGIARARELGASADVRRAARVLGSGSRVTAPDTVPFVLWSAARHLDRYEEALWETVAGLGDRDTTCAMVGGIVAARTGRAGIPGAWITATEPLPG